MLIAALLAAGCGSTEAESAAQAQRTEAAQSTEESAAGAAAESETAEASVADAAEKPEIAEESAADEQAGKEAAYLEFAEGRLFGEDLPDGDLPKPKGTVSSLDDLVYILDYMAFYRVGDKIWFDFDEAYAEQFYNPYTEYQKAYLQSDLADVYACQMDDSYYSEFGVIGIKYSMSRDIASEAPENISDAPVVPSFDYGRNAPAEENGGRQDSGGQLYAGVENQEAVLPIENSSLPEISCENGEQLYYLAMNGYRPLPEAGSIAEELYRKAKEAVFACTDSEMSDFQKIKAVYDWLTTEVVYDSETAYTSETYLVKEQAYYLEGVFFNHCAVCDGKAKACALMLNMLGIPCYRTTGVNEGGDHAWNMVQLEGKWYILCTTYGQADMSETLGRHVPNYSMLLADAQTPYEWYPAQKHPDIEALVESEPYDIFAEMEISDGLSLSVEGMDDLKSLLQQAAECGKEEYKVEFQYAGSEKEGFTEEMIAFLETLENANAAEVRSENGNVFQVMVLSGQG